MLKSLRVLVSDAKILLASEHIRSKKHIAYSGLAILLIGSHRILRLIPSVFQLGRMNPNSAAKNTSGAKKMEKNR